MLTSPATRTENESAYLRKTYRYIRLTMVGIVAALAVSVLIERIGAGCWQTSLSGYYYTPVRAIFVGGLMANGVCLVAIQGSTRWEDTFFNFAGLMAPMVAVLPTTRVDECWSTPPPALPVVDGMLAPWVMANVNNNIVTLLIVGFAGLIITSMLATLHKGSVAAFLEASPHRRYGLLATFILLAVIALAYWRWDEFPERAHPLAAIALFAFLAAGVAVNAYQRWLHNVHPGYMVAYGVLSLAMIGVGAGGWFLLGDWPWKVLVIESAEAALFVAFWLLQTFELWDQGEPVIQSAPKVIDLTSGSESSPGVGQTAEPTGGSDSHRQQTATPARSETPAAEPDAAAHFEDRGDDSSRFDDDEDEDPTRFEDDDDDSARFDADDQDDEDPTRLDDEDDENSARFDDEDDEDSTRFDDGGDRAERVSEDDDDLLLQSGQPGD